MQLLKHHPIISFVVLFISSLIIIGFSVITPTKAAGKIQYKAIAPDMPNVGDNASVQRVLDKASSEGWEFVGSTAQVMIFRK